MCGVGSSGASNPGSFLVSAPEPTTLDIGMGAWRDNEAVALAIPMGRVGFDPEPVKAKTDFEKNVTGTARHRIQGVPALR